MQATIFFAIVATSLAQTPEYTTGGETFVVSEDHAPVTEYAGFDASLLPELATGVTWSSGEGEGMDFGPMEAYPITAEELALRDDISDIFVSETSYQSDYKGSMQVLSAGPATAAADSTWNGVGSYDQYGTFQVIENMFCDPMDLGELVEEAEDVTNCKQLCLQDATCAAANYYPVPDPDDPLASVNPFIGCYHFSSCDENSRKPNAFGSTLFIKQDTLLSQSPTLSTRCEEDIANGCDSSSTECVMVVGASSPSCECLPGYVPSSSPLSCDLIQQEGVAAAVLELAGIKETSSDDGEAFMAAVAGVVGGFALVMIAVVHYRSKTAAKGNTLVQQTPAV
jgi:hypothetical protein